MLTKHIVGRGMCVYQIIKLYTLNLHMLHVNYISNRAGGNFFKKIKAYPSSHLIDIYLDQELVPFFLRIPVNYAGFGVIIQEFFKCFQ